MTTVMKASGSTEFLGLVPALAGFTPRRSIVLVPFEGKRAYGALRMDLPDDPVEFAEPAVALTRRVPGTEAVAIVVYCEETALATRDGLVLPHAVLVDEVLASAEEARLGIVDALCVTPEGWSSYLDDDPALNPLDAIATRPLPPGIALEADQSAGADLPVVSLLASERVGRALIDLDQVLCRIRLDRPVPAGRENPQALAAAALLDDVTGMFEEALDLPEDAPPFLVAALLWLLDQPVYRDVALVQWATDQDGGERALDAQLEYRSSRVMPDGSARMLVGEGPRPDAARLHAALRAVRRLAALAPRAKRVGPLAVAAWLSWALGRTSHAEKHLEQVRGIAPDYSFGRLLGELLLARPLPEWAFHRRAADAA
ncbi:DUF4192 family protein [Microbacterium sp. CIAB417]|uniref:DUF4192 family protein n=1 Tax=Microbacterium sp. CIAB417 TaxID=2860287 RepID=UPI001FACA08F|nr:DUF4192 family protein [Microbacterium sp. CIAB417]